MPRRIWRSTAAIVGAGPWPAIAPVSPRQRSDVLVAVDASEAGARRLVDEERERRRPLDHPVHRDAVEEGAPGPLVERGGARVGGAEPARARSSSTRVRRSRSTVGWACASAIGTILRRPGLQCHAIPGSRDSRSFSSVGSAGVAADLAVGDACAGVDGEVGRAAVRAAHGPVGCCRAAPLSAHRHGSASHRRDGGGSRSHSLFLPPPRLLHTQAEPERCSLSFHVRATGGAGWARPCGCAASDDRGNHDASGPIPSNAARSADPHTVVPVDAGGTIRQTSVARG